MAATPEDVKKKRFFCQRCKKTLAGTKFYTSKNLEKYPNSGKLNMCIDCITAHVNNWDSDTYKWILEECDVPYVPSEWNKILKSLAGQEKQITKKSVIGRYLSKMKLNQYGKFNWRHSEYLQKVEREKLESSMKEAGFDTMEIEQAKKDLDKINVPFAQEDVEVSEDFIEKFKDAGNTFKVQPKRDPFAAYDEVSLDNKDDDLTSQLTDEDKTYLRLKWGRAYSPIEWIQLERLFQEMLASYDIQAAGDVNSLIIACKSSLKANQLLDLGDIEGAQKVSKIYNDMMKAGKWTAAQNKAEGNDIVDAVSELVAICERDGFIPRYYVEQPNDKVDRVIQDQQHYTYNLVTEELGLGNLIEQAIKDIKEESERINAARELAEGNSESKQEDELFNYDQDILSDQDISDFHKIMEGDDEDNDILE